MTKHGEGDSTFESRKFTDWATVKEALIGERIDAVFILAPMAMQLKIDGVGVKVVYLGHRDGTAIVVGADSDIRDFADLEDKRCAIPSRYSNQNLLMHKMMKQWNMEPGSIDLIELPPPDHPTALENGSIDAYIVGEPFAALSEMNGTGRVLYQTKDIWEDFISCVLVVREDVINDERAIVQELVDGIAKSGKWLDESMQNRMEAAEIAAANYYFQDPDLLRYVLSKPVDRVKYTQLGPLKDDFDEIMELGFEIGVLPRRIDFEEYVDDTFVRPLSELDWNMEHLAGADQEAAAAAAEAIMAELEKSE